MNSKTHTPLPSGSSEDEHLQKSKQKPSAEPAEKTERKAAGRRKSRHEFKPGEVFGRLTVLGFTRLRGVPFLAYACSCGNLGVAKAANLTNGVTKSCGCLKSTSTRRKYPKIETGEIFGRLTIIGHAKHSGKIKCAYVCECGNLGIVSESSLRRGNTSSCGCGIRDSWFRIPRWWVYVFKNIVGRCYNPSNGSWHNYGARGISVYDDWLKDPKAMLDYIGPKPTKAHSLDRIDNDGNYEPGNVRWATQKEQANNRRTNVFLEFNGELKTVTQWAEIFKIDAHTIRHRIKAGWSAKDAISKPQSRRDSAGSSNAQASHPSVPDTACASSG